MITQTKWFERKFNFDFPAGYFPCILERLRGTAPRLEELVQSLSSKILVTQVNGGWSIQEHAGHLCDLDELHTARLEDYRLNRPVLRAADLANRKTFEAHYNNKTIQSILQQFRSARGHFIQLLEPLDETALSQTALHPRLQQPMRLVDMAFFVAEHDDHHLTLMRSLTVQLQK